MKLQRLYFLDILKENDEITRNDILHRQIKANLISIGVDSFGYIS